MEKILLLGINARYTHSNLAIRYIRNSIADLPVKTVLREVTINQPVTEILETIWKVKPDVLAISVYIWNSEIVKKIIVDIENILPKTTVVLGGPEVSYNSQRWLSDYSQIDHIIIGNGENGLKYLLSENPISKTIFQPAKPFSETCFPYLDEDFPEIIGKYIYYETSRGCPFRCSYCLSSRSDQKLDFKPLAIIYKELDYLISKNPKIIKFVDRTFNAKPKHYQPIWEYLIAKSPQIKFHCEIHPEILSEKDFEILATSPKDLFQFEIGIQSTNAKTIATINRKDDWGKSKANILRLIALEKFHIHTDLIVGLPYENLQSLAKSFNDIYSLGAEHFQMGFLKILPGTQMEREADKFDITYSNNPPYEIFSNKWLNYAEMLHLKIIENLIDKYVNSEKFKNTLNFCIEQFGSPFIFYSKFANYYQKNGIDGSVKNWQKNGKTLLDFMKEYFPQKEKALIDFLRFDWCNHSGGKIPNILQNEFIKKLQKDSYDYLKSFNKSGIIKYREKNFDTKTIKNANYFLAESDEFYEILNKQKEVIMFKDLEQIIICK